MGNKQRNNVNAQVQSSARLELVNPQDLSSKPTQLKIITCDICFEPSIEVQCAFTCPCKLKICNECFLNWWVTSLRSNISQIETKTVCPGAQTTSKCVQVFNDGRVSQLLSRLPMFQQIIDQINDVMLEKYMIQQNDVRRCPKQGCNYAGFLNIDSECFENLSCLQCKHSWRDPLHYTSYEKFKIGLTDFVMMRTDFLLSLIHI